MERDYLEWLEKIQLPSWGNSITYFKNKYPDYNERAKDIKRILDELLAPERKFIILSEEEFYKNLGRVNGDERITFEQIESEGVRIDAKLTMAGRHYLESVRRVESQDRLNNSLRVYNKWQIGLTIVIALATIVSAWAALKQNTKSSGNEKVQQQMLRSLESQQHLLESKLTEMQIAETLSLK